MTYNLNKKHTEDLKNGLIAIDNTGNPNVKLLRQVLIEVFPNDGISFTTGGTCKYYHTRNSVYWTLSDNKPSLPTIKLLDFIQEVLPKEFIVECHNGEQVTILGDIYGKFSSYYTFSHWKYVVISDGYSEKWNIFNSIPEDKCHLKLYTFKEWEKLKQLDNNMKEKEIIGYKAPYDLFGGNYKKGTVFVKDWGDRKFRYKPEGCVDSSYWNIAEEIVKTWEPVYKSSEVTIKMGNSFDLVVKDGKVWHGTEDITSFVTEMCDNLKHLITTTVKEYGTISKKYSCVIKEITFSKTGCQNVETKLSEWINVYNELKKQQ